ncbi:MAG: DNA-protecting protein DprA [Herminiimonas sp.]|nr:DNA-protecting protein DprA [Herminiimonas sp.]
MPDEQELAGWLRLDRTADVGPATARKLLAAFGLPHNIFSSSLAALGEVVPARVAQALRAPLSSDTQALIDRTLAWTALPGNHALTLADTAYPRALLEIADPPLILYAKGDIRLLSAPSVAVVGSRNATAQGLANADAFSAALCAAGWTVVSGMALGIDTAAHRGCLRTLGNQTTTNGSTVAVIGTGADIVYPARNRALAHEIVKAGCIVSEYPLGTPPIASNFPRRNRIISGLSRGVLVIEAAAQSGSLITARMAAEQGREVFAIPGSIHSPLAKGCHQLIRQGAKLVESAQDILEELQSGDLAGARAVSPARPLFRTASVASGASVGEIHGFAETSDPVLLAMGFEPVSQDALAVRCAIDSAALSAQLLTLELQGHVELLPGGAYQRLR